MPELEPLHAGVTDLLAGVDGAAWDLPTPCDDWSVADLARHLVAGERAFTIALGGTAYDLAAITAEVGVIEVAALPQAYADAAAGVRAALAAVPAGALVPSPLGPVEPEVVAEIRALEAVAHGWDLGVALGRPLGRAASYDVDLEPLVGATDRLRAGLEVTRPGNTAYGTAIEVADDAPTLDRLLARLGRRV